MSSNATDSSETDRLDNDYSSSPKRVKVSSKNCSLLQLFVESLWEKNEICHLGDWLTSQGADVNAKNWYLLWRYNNYRKESEKDTFKMTIASRLRDVLPLLLKCNDDIDYTDADGQTILHAYLANDKKYCSLYNSLTEPKDLKIIKSLLDKGASLNAVDKRNQTPLHLAVNNKNLTLIESMLDYVDNYTDVCDDEGDTVLHKVVKRIYDDDNVCSGIARALLSRGADANKKNKEGMTPLHYVAKHCKVNLLPIFKEHGGDFDVHTDNGDNLLHLAYKDGVYVEESRRAEAINYLLEHQGCDVNLKNKDGFAVIHLIAKRHLAITTLQQFIELGSGVKHRARKIQRSPLQSASTNNRESTIRTARFKTVISRCTDTGADWDARDSEGLTPLHRALLVDNSAAVSCILSFGANVNDRKVRELLKNCGGGSRNAVIRRAVELKAMNFQIDKAYQSPIDKRQDLRDYQERCVSEIEAMKKYEIRDGVSLYQFIHMNWKHQLDLVPYVPQDLRKNFPIYCGSLQNACNEAKRRSKLLQSAITAWYKFTKIDLPLLCVERILFFLNNCSLNLLIYVSEAMT